ncbi:MAG TPA: cysteine--tRNA ligase, partial [Chroococcales cyanobacterium]
MNLFNSLSKTTEPFKPLTGDGVRMYSCGPTVYDHIHIGNLSAFIYADTLRRVLKASGYRVQHIMNFTDVDDKTIRRSRESYPDMEPRLALEKLTSDYTSIFLDDMTAVGNDIEDMKFIKATDAIPHMQELIRRLYEQKFAYIADDGVYFSIQAYKNSGKVYGQLVELTESSTSEERIANDEYDKENVHDFALWKTQKPGEPAWDFELDGHELVGRPGWHIECSAMSTEQLGQPFDIHTGGVDLKFPHHENEIAQSTAGQDDPLYANIFVHNEHMLVDGQKMSKS